MIGLLWNYWNHKKREFEDSLEEEHPAVAALLTAGVDTQLLDEVREKLTQLWMETFPDPDTILHDKNVKIQEDYQLFLSNEWTDNPWVADYVQVNREKLDDLKNKRKPQVGIRKTKNKIKVDRQQAATPKSRPSSSTPQRGRPKSTPSTPLPATPILPTPEPITQECFSSSQDPPLLQGTGKRPIPPEWVAPSMDQEESVQEIGRSLMSFVPSFPVSWQDNPPSSVPPIFTPFVDNEEFDEV